jgi:hypothetical protein
MTIAASLRWERAQHIDRSAIEPPGLGWYIVPSSHPKGDGSRSHRLFTLRLPGGSRAPV